jgi:hypothetical protein
MKFDVAIEGLDELQREWNRSFLPKLRRGVRVAVQRSVDRGVQVAKAHVNRSDKPSGSHLKDDIFGRVTGEVAGGIPAIEGEIVAPKPYAIYLENGTAPHIIRPKTGAFGPLQEGQSRKRGAKPHLLVFKVNGQWVSKKEVHHPGTAPHPFMGVAYIAVEQRLEAEVEKAVLAAVESFNGGA